MVGCRRQIAGYRQQTAGSGSGGNGSSSERSAVSRHARVGPAGAHRKLGGKGRREDTAGDANGGNGIPESRVKQLAVSSAGFVYWPKANGRSWATPLVRNGHLKVLKKLRQIWRMEREDLGSANSPYWTVLSQKGM